MTNSSESSDRIMRHIQKLRAKMSVYFGRVQALYDTIDEGIRLRQDAETFLSSASTILTNRTEFVALLDEVNDLEASASSTYVFNFNSLNAYDDMYARIKYTVDKIKNHQGRSEIPNKNDNSNHIKLPKLEIASFSGEIENWPIFYEVFRSVIHENRSLSNSEKVQYLVGRLTGRALNICKGITPTGENYVLLWDALCKKYNDKRALAVNYLDQLLKLSPVAVPSPTSLESFIDKYSTIIAAMKQLKIDNLCEFIFVHLGLKCLDNETVRCFEMSLRDKNKEMPSSQELIDFVREQYRILSRAHTMTSRPPPAPARSQSNVQAIKKPQQSHTNTSFKSFVTIQNDECIACKSVTHPLYRCAQFIAMVPSQRFDLIKTAKTSICVICLQKHRTRDCKSQSKCRICFRNRNTLLHFDNNNSHIIQSSQSATQSVCPVDTIQPNNNNLSAPTLTPIAKPANQATQNSPRDQVVSQSLCCMSAPLNVINKDISSTVLLGTALCNTLDSQGETQIVRVLVDSACQRELITRECCTRLNLTINNTIATNVAGVGNISSKTHGVTNLNITSRIDKNVSFLIQPYVVDCITGELPSVQVRQSELQYLTGLQLADQTFCSPGKIDLILGCDIFARILLKNKIMGSVNEPVAIETSLGYLIVGTAPTCNYSGTVSDTYSYCCTFADCERNTNLSRFFELEEVPNVDLFTPDEQECEKIYVDTTSRDVTGRYQTGLPFKCDPVANLGNSKTAAERRFLSLERRLASNPQLKSDYDGIITDYLQKGYLVPVSENQRNIPDYVIPHHAVIREDKTTTKVRMVLDASTKSDSNRSLNDILYTGKNLQSDLFKIILQFRLNAIAINADIRQMYLQIVVRECDRRYQRILYRFNSDDNLTLYEFTRVIFGTSASPFLAMRTVRQLALDEKDKYPIASAAIEQEALYMDDLAINCESVYEAQQLSNQLINMFAAGGFELVKFCSNSPELMASIPAECRVTESLSFSPNDELKILGLHWSPATDNFTFTVNNQERKCTKRNILSTIARLWDIMGFVAPVILLAKLIVKSLWEQKIEWDECPPQNIVTLWKQFEAELPLLNSVQIPRYIGYQQGSIITLLGFSDSSESSFGTVLYLHVYCPVTHCSKINLLCAKSKTSPSCQFHTIARLELCGILLMARLMRTVIDTLSQRVTIQNIFAFSDSKVALAWIYSNPNRWQTFVANRVSKIQGLLDVKTFHHISGKENPADCLSGGLTPAQLIDHPLWFSGPGFACLPFNEWPVHGFDVNSVIDPPEVKNKVLLTTHIAAPPPPPPLLYELACRVSSWNKLVRIVIYILRFIKKLPRKFELSHIEIAEFEIIRAVQQVYFANEFKCLNENRKLPKKFSKLNAFAENGLLRVGGRLVNSEIGYDSKHPLLLPGHDHIVNLIIDNYHQKYLHTGSTLLMSLLRQKYWILSARNAVRKRVHACNLCFRAEPKNLFPKMADLPAFRVCEAKPFLHTGVDYAGPLTIIPYRRRDVRSQKAYICLFICMVTHGVHIELSSSLSTEAFLNAFKRFLSRRGPVSVIYSDNGTNFVGARSEMKQLYDIINSPEYQNEFTKSLQENEIAWKLNPPYAPHMGGMWEANIKSCKRFLNKIVAKQLLTFEEMLTVLSQIEALLNSRPLSLDTCSDPSDPLPLTPAHFLTLTPLKSLPAPDLSAESVNLMQRKHLVDHLVQSFWKRWRIEYLNTLQTRQKWNSNSILLRIGTIVLLKEDNTPPLQWPLGIIVNTYPGKDGIVRVVDVKTQSNTYRRPVVKLCPLPTQ